MVDKPQRIIITYIQTVYNSYTGIVYLVADDYTIDYHKSHTFDRSLKWHRVWTTHVLSQTLEICQNLVQTDYLDKKEGRVEVFDVIYAIDRITHNY